MRANSVCETSTRYCNYAKDKFGNEITFIKPINIKDNTDEYAIWYKTIDEFTSMSIEDAAKFIENLALTKKEETLSIYQNNGKFNTFRFIGIYINVLKIFIRIIRRYIDSFTLGTINMLCHS